MLPPRPCRLLLLSVLAVGLASSSAAATIEVTPPTAASQIASAAAGDELHFSPGIYPVESPWNLPAGVLLSGGDGVTIQLVSPEGALVAAGDVALSKLEFTTSVADSSPLLATNGNIVNIESCTFRSFGGSPVFNAIDSRLNISDSRFIECPGAITIAGSDSQPSALSISGSTFSAPMAQLPPFVRASGNTEVDISATMQGGGRAVVLEQTAAPARIHDCVLAGSRVSAVAFIEPRASIVIKNCEVKGSYGAGAFHVIGGADSGNAAVSIDNVRGKNLGVTGAGFGLLTIVAPGNFAEVSLNQLTLNGTTGSAIRLVSHGALDRPSVRITAQALVLSDWECGVDASLGGGGPATLVLSGELADCDAAVRAAGKALSLETGERLQILRGRDGIVLSGGTNATIENAFFELCAGGAIIASDRAQLRITGSSFNNCAVGAHVMAGAGTADLGTEGQPGKNVFRVHELTQFAVRNESGSTIDAMENRWYYSDAECFGRTAIDDMIDDGDADNPLGEHGSGEVLLDINSHYEGNVLSWDVKADRRVRGYGSTVFRSIDDIEPRIGTARELTMGSGTYEIPGLPDRAFVLSGSGSGQTTIITRDTNGVFAERRAPLTLRDVSLAPPADTVPPGIKWTGADLHLIHVEMSGFARPLFSASPGEEEITVSFGLFEESPSANSNEGMAAFEAKDRPILIDDVRLRSKAPAFLWTSSMGDRTLESRRLHIEQLDTHDGAAATVTGSGVLSETTIYQAGGTALRLNAVNGDSLLVIDGLEAEGFDDAAIEIGEGAYAALEIKGAELVPSEDESGRATGLRFGRGASAPLVVNGFHGSDLRPGILVEGNWTGGRLEEVELELSTEFNALDQEETGIEMAFQSKGAGPFDLLGLDITGYDNGLYFTKDMDCATTLTLGNTMATGANRFTRNGVGLRVASPGARMVMREDRNRSEFSANGVAILVEDGTLRMDNARLLNNQAGVIVRAGTVDLGGGPLGGLGGNLLWPQAGAYAIINETKATIFALQNRWGDATALLYTDAAPVSDARNNPEAGPVLLVKGAE